MFKIKEVDAKTTPRKKNLELKNLMKNVVKLFGKMKKLSQILQLKWDNSLT